MGPKIDTTDRAIVELLMEDGRMPAAEIANRLGNITERAVRYRLNRLIEDELIRVCAIARPEALGFPVRAEVYVQTEANQIMDIAQQIMAFECVSYVACSIGETDISLQVVGRTNAEIFSFLTDVLGKIPGVRKTTTSIVPLTLKEPQQWHIPQSICTPKEPSSD